MTYLGHVKNGVVLLDDAVSLPDGTPVQVLVSSPTVATNHASVPTLFEQMKSVIGRAQGLPSDLAENHDHYLHWLPKK
jgi:hypothetical protein